MMEVPSSHPSWIAEAGHICEYASAIFGIFGTVLMSRRLIPKFWRGMLFAASYPVMVVLLQGSRVRQYFISRAKLGEDSLPDMTLGINLLIWGFFLQLISLILK
jgi:hypothetical protein